MSIVFLVIPYGSEIWTLITAQIDAFVVAQRKMELIVLSVKTL